MKVIIAGTPTIKSYKLVLDAIRESKFEITELVSGSYKGAGELGVHYAHIHNIPIKVFSTNFKDEGWFTYSVQIQAMADYAEALIIILDCKPTHEDKEFLERMRNRGKKVYVKNV